MHKWVSYNEGYIQALYNYKIRLLSSPNAHAVIFCMLKAFKTTGLLCWLGEGEGLRLGARATLDQHIPRILPHCHAAVS